MGGWNVLAVPTIAWFVAQAIKYGLRLRNNGFQIGDLYTSGGFPSSHTASTVALASFIGATDGWTSHIFAVAAMFTAVVMYDAVGVRRIVGEHTDILKELSKKHGNQIRVRNQRTGHGHTPLEVIGGVLVGSIVGLLFATLS